MDINTAHTPRTPDPTTPVRLVPDVAEPTASVATSAETVGLFPRQPKMLMPSAHAIADAIIRRAVAEVRG